jgi:hypothetical protein
MQRIRVRHILRSRITNFALLSKESPNRSNLLQVCFYKILYWKAVVCLTANSAFVQDCGYISRLLTWFISSHLSFPPRKMYPNSLVSSYNFSIAHTDTLHMKRCQTGFLVRRWKHFTRPTAYPIWWQTLIKFRKLLNPKNMVVSYLQHNNQELFSDLQNIYIK